MTEPIKLPSSRVYNVTVVAPEDGRQDRLGRWYVRLQGSTAERLPRRNPNNAAALDTLEVAEVQTASRKDISLIGVDGTVWRLKSCGCGG